MPDSVAHQPVRRGSRIRLRADGDEIRHLLATTSGRTLVCAVAAIAALTLIGLLALWPYGWDPPGSRVTGTVPATVERVTDAPCGGAASECRTIVVSVDGREVSAGLGPVRNAPSVAPGDSVRMLRGGSPDVRPPAGRFVHYDFVEVDRRGSLVWLALAFAVLAAALLRWRGVLAIAGVALSLAVVLCFLVPAILAGRPALLVALVASLTVMFVTLVLTNGLGTQTMAAALGVSATVVLTCLLAFAAASFAHLDGTSDLETLALRAGSDTLSLQGVILASMLIGALGVLADTAVTQASAVMALRRANPRYGAQDLYREAFTIGRDHLSATIHTLVLAYAGAALPLLLVVRNGNVAAVDALSGQSIAVPVVATIVGCVALIAAVPLTTGLASMLLSRLPLEAVSAGHQHHH